MTKHTPDIDQIFNALSDPTRRAILTRLADNPKTVSQLAEPFDMSLPSLMGHLKKLEEIGLIKTRKKGRVRTCALNPSAFTPALGWLEDQRVLWTRRLDLLDAMVLSMSKEKANERP